MAKRKKKTFKDMLGKEIQVGDECMHLWLTMDRRGWMQDSGKAGVKNKRAIVIKVNDKSIRIRHRDKEQSESNVFTTENRIIVTENGKLIVGKDYITNEEIREMNIEMEKYKKESTKENKKLEKRNEKLEEQNKALEEQGQKIDKQNKELKEVVASIKRTSHRFEIMDL
jgi:hypothetical protein